MHRSAVVPQVAEHGGRGGGIVALNGLLREGNALPRSVSVEFDDEYLMLRDSRGWSETIGLGALRIREERPGSLVLGRQWRRGFSLQLSSEAARQARELLPPSRSLPRRIFALATSSPKLAITLMIAPFIIADHVPGQWYAHVTPKSAAARLESRAIEQARSDACDDASGQAALDALVRKLEGPGVPTEAIALRDPSFMVSARPGGQLLIFGSAVTEVDAEVLAALIAHELGHKEANQTLGAAGRAEEGDFPLRLILPWWDKSLVEMQYTRKEERMADHYAMVALRRAGIALRPAAEFFARIDQANQRDSYWAQEYSNRHSGVPNRAAVWATAANAQGSARPALSERQADELFNICWERPSGVTSKWADLPIRQQ